MTFLQTTDFAGIMLRKLILSFILLCSFTATEAKLPDISAPDVTAILKKIFKEHATYKCMDATLVKRALQSYVEELDPSKTYFIESEVKPWIDPSDATVKALLDDYSKSNFSVFENISNLYVQAIKRRDAIEKEISLDTLPKNIDPAIFKDVTWAKNTEELQKRLIDLKALQLEVAEKITDPDSDVSLTLQRIDKRRLQREEKYLSTQMPDRERLVLSNVLKATTLALDAHSNYFTPDEASQFLITVQQRLFGIGVQLRDDITKFSVVRIIDGGPANLSTETNKLKKNDGLIAVDGEPVVGMDISDAVELIRGAANTKVTLTVLRVQGEGTNKKTEKLDISIIRGEVILKESRIESSYEPYGDGAIAYIKLFSFYQDEHYSSAGDIDKALETLRKDHLLKGVILDLRYNSGGILPQAVAVTGLFITKGVVVSVKNNKGKVEHLGTNESRPVWGGPLIVLTNRASASAAEIVAQTLQDYGRAIIVGDDHTYGKGTYQTFSLDSRGEQTNPKGEYKVTKGKYYTVSGRSPQLVGVLSDITAPSALIGLDIGEKHTKWPLQSDVISAAFDEDTPDMPFLDKQQVSWLYKFHIQQRLTLYTNYLEILKKNSETRIGLNKGYQNFLKEIAKYTPDPEPIDSYLQNDLQLVETYNIMKDLLSLMHSDESKKRAKE